MLFGQLALCRSRINYAEPNLGDHRTRGCLPQAASKEAGRQSPVSTHTPTKPTHSLRRQDRPWPSGAGLSQRRTLPGSQLTCSQTRLSLISLHFPHKCSSLTHLDASFLHLRSFSWTSPFSWAHSFFTLSFHQPWGSRGTGGGKSPLLFCRAAKHGSSFYSSPLQTLYQRSIRAQSGSALLPKYHTKILVLMREKPNFSLMRHTERASDPCYHSTFPVFISKAEYKQR